MTTAAKFEAREVPLNEIHIWPDQPRPRTHFTPEKLAELEASVREDGLQTPINLRPRPAGGFLITAGERRFTVLKTLGFKVIPAVIGPAIDDAKAMKLALIENIQRKDLHAAEEFSALVRLQAMDGACKDHRVLAGQLSVPVSHVKRVMRLGKLHKDALAAFAADAITFAHVDLLVQHNQTVQLEALRDGCFYEIFHDDAARKAIKAGRWAELREHMAPVRLLTDWLDQHATVDLTNAEVQERLPEIAAHVAKAPEKVVRLSDQEFRVPNGVLKRHGYGALREGYWIELKKGESCPCAAEGIVVHGGPTRLARGCWDISCKKHNPPAPKRETGATSTGKKAKPDPWQVKQRREEQKRREWGGARNASWPTLWPALLKHVTKVDAVFVRALLSAHNLSRVSDVAKAKLTDSNALAYLAASALLDWRTEGNRTAFTRLAKGFGFDMVKFERDRAKAKKAAKAKPQTGSAAKKANVTAKSKSKKGKAA